MVRVVRRWFKTIDIFHYPKCHSQKPGRRYFWYFGDTNESKRKKLLIIISVIQSTCVKFRQVVFIQPKQHMHSA
jgi:hypothetical protein